MSGFVLHILRLFTSIAIPSCRCWDVVDVLALTRAGIDAQAAGHQIRQVAGVR